MSGATAPLNHYGRRLIRHLRDLRQQTGLTQEEAGNQVRIEFKKLSRIESRQLPTYHELVMLLEVYGIADSDLAPYIELWEQAKQRAWWREFGLRDDSGYLAAENGACAMLEFQLGYVPELLQTADYARELQKHMTSTPEQDLDASLNIVHKRQDRLCAETDQRLSVHFIVHEPVLRQPYDRPQLLQLMDYAKLPNVTLQVLPQSVGLHPGLVSSMVLFGFPDTDQPDEAFIPDITAGFRPVKQADVQLVGQTLRDLERLAMNTRNTLQLLGKLVEES